MVTEAVKAPRAANDDVVEDLQVHEFSCIHQSLCDLFIGIAWIYVTRWMVVGNDQGMGIGKESTFEDFTRMDKGCVQCPFADHLRTNDLILGIHVQGMELLRSLFMESHALQEIGDHPGTGDPFTVVMQSGFGDQLDMVTGDYLLILMCIDEQW